MNFVEVVRGIGNVALVMALAGIVAYVGDRVGHQVGRKRLSLFGIRPRYTSTIVAIATGMVIALVVTLAAIFASQQVKTAFFKLNSINAANRGTAGAAARSRSEGQHRAAGLPGRHADGAVLPHHPINRRAGLAPPNDPRLLLVSRSSTSTERIRGWACARTRFRPTPTRSCEDSADDLTTAAKLSQANVMLTVTSDQNLFENDQIHFAINVTPDIRYFQKGQLIAQLVIPGKSGASINIALIQLQNYVSITRAAAGPAAVPSRHLSAAAVDPRRAADAAADLASPGRIC